MPSHEMPKALNALYLKVFTKLVLPHSGREECSMHFEEKDQMTASPNCRALPNGYFLHAQSELLLKT